MAYTYESSEHDNHACSMAFSCAGVTDAQRLHDSLVRRDEASDWRRTPYLGAGDSVGLGSDCGAWAEHASECSSTSSPQRDLSADSSQEFGDWDDVEGVSVPKVFHGDVVQIVSVASKANDGVLISRDDELTASGYINRQGSACDSGVKAFFHCHEFGPLAKEGVDRRLFLLVPVARTANGTFTCPVKDAERQTDPVLRMMPVLAVVETGGVRRLVLKCVDPESVRTASDCRWRVAVLSGDASSRMWRMSAEVDRGGVYAAADCAGLPYATSDEMTDGLNDGFENPQTFFYLYRRFIITDDDS